MTEEDDRKPRRSFLETVKAPLIFSFVLGFVAGFVTLIVSSGGSDNERVDQFSGGMNSPVNLALVAFGIAFIASLLLVSMLQLASRENPEHLSEGSGVNRNSEELYRKQVAERREKLRREREAKEREEAGDPAYGKRVDDDDAQPNS